MKRASLPSVVVAGVVATAVCAGASSSTAHAAPAPDAPAGRADHIDRVTVFADRAEVTRVAPARCVDGVAAVVFAQLPASLDARGLRAEASAGATPVGVATNLVALSSSENPEVQALREQVRGIDRALAAHARAQDDDDERQRSTQGYGPLFRTAIAEELRQAKPDVARFEQLLTMMTSETSAAANARVQRAAAMRDLQRQREQLVARLDHLGEHLDGNDARLDATVSVRCDGTTTPTVRLSYVVPGARWVPEYDLHIASSTTKIGDVNASLTVAGLVSQSTGEDWDDAELWLSTAKPLLGGEAPLPAPLWITAAPVTTQKTLVQAEEERAADLGAGQRNDGAPQSAALQDGGKSFVLKLPRRVHVRADGRANWFPVDELSTKARASLVAVPSLVGNVHRVAAFGSPAPYPLMAGRVNVFRGATFVGTEDLAYRAPGEPVELSLGVDDDIKLERIDLLGARRESPLLSGDQTIGYGMRTVLKNRGTEDVVVELREQIPVSKTADIHVTLHADKTAPGYTLDDVRGHLTWKVALKKGESASRDLDFAIALPKDWLVQ